VSDSDRVDRLFGTDPAEAARLAAEVQRLGFDAARLVVDRFAQMFDRFSRDGGGGAWVFGGGGGGSTATAAVRPPRTVLLTGAASASLVRPTIMISVLPRRTTAPGSSTTRPVTGTPLTSVPFRLPRSTRESATGLGTSLRWRRDTPSSASTSPSQSRPTSIARSTTTRRACFPCSLISMIGDPAIS